MSIKLLSLVWESSQHKGGNLLVLLAIADYADEHGIAYPSVKKLAEKSRLSTRAVQYALQALYESGELELVSEGRFDKANVYRVNAKNLQKREGAQILRYAKSTAP